MAEDRNTLAARALLESYGIRVARYVQGGGEHPMVPYIVDALAKAQRAGAEAMREQAARAMLPMLRDMISRGEAARTIRALPLPAAPAAPAEAAPAAEATR